MKKVFLMVPVLFLSFSLSTQAVAPLAGHTIGLDAGHGNGVSGAVGYCGGIEVPEYLVNEAVRNELTTLIEGVGGDVYPIAQLSTRKDRVADAETNGSEILISIHHNGSTNTGADYTQSFVTQKNDRDLAKEIQPELVTALGLTDKGIKNDGYGMTVYGSLPGVLTESYFITNTEAACDFVDYQNGATSTRVHSEAQAMFNGLTNYYTKQAGGGSDGGGQCSTGQEKQGKC